MKGSGGVMAGRGRVRELARPCGCAWRLRRRAGAARSGSLARAATWQIGGERGGRTAAIQEG